MKIHLISNMYPSKSAPSYGVFVQNIVNILVRSGFAVEKTVLYKHSTMLTKAPAYIFYFLKIMFKVIFKHYDVHYVHYAAHNSLPLLCAKLLKPGMKIYTNVHGSDVVPEVKKREKLQKYVKKLLQVSEAVIVPSDYYRRLVQEKYELQTPIVVFPSGGVNKNVFYERKNKGELFAGFHLERDKKYIGFVGRLDYGKGWEVLLEAVYQFKEKGELGEWRVAFVGDGRERERFWQRVKELNLEPYIAYFPLLSQRKLAELFNCLELFCFPTKRKGESLGLVGLEAMACGIPVLGSRIGGLLDYIRDGKNGFLFTVGDAGDLMEKWRSYRRLSPEKKYEMRENAKKTASRYEQQQIEPRLIEIFHALQKNGSPSEGRANKS